MMKAKEVERPYKDSSGLMRYKAIGICQCTESRGPDGGVCGKCGNAILSFSEEELIRELLKLKEGYNKLIDAWDSLKGGQRYNATTIQNWLIKQMQPDIENSRELLSRKSPN